MATLSRDEKVALIHKFFDANAKKSGELFDFIHDDIEFSIPEMELADATGHMARGKEAFVKLQSGDFDAFPDLHCPIDRIIVDGETAVMQGRMIATDLSHLASVLPGSGDGADRPPQMAFRKVTIFDFEGDKIIKLMAYYDIFNYMVLQLGVPTEVLIGMRDSQLATADAT